LGTLKGNIIKAIAVDDLREWREIRDKTGLDDNQIKSITDELRSEGILERRYSGFWVDYDLWIEYKAHFGDEWAIKKLEELEEEREEERLVALMEKKKLENHLRGRVRDWIKFKKIDVNPKCSHVYLRGDLLDSLIRDLIPLVNKEILVINPYVEKCSLCDMLLTASQKGIDVKLITQSTEKTYEGKRKEDKIRYHRSFKESDVKLYYNESVHAKLFILDNQVLSVSSMNLYSDSIAGKLWEAGIVTTDANNVKLAKKTFDQLINHTDSIYQS